MSHQKHAFETNQSAYQFSHLHKKNISIEKGETKAAKSHYVSKLRIYIENYPFQIVKVSCFREK